MFIGGMVLLSSLGRAALVHLRKKDDRWTSAGAGALGALALLVDTPSRRQSIALYILVRSIYAALHTLMRRQYITRVPYFAHLLFGIANVPILTALIWGDRTLLDQGYLRWLLNMANLDRHAIDWTIVEPAMGLDLRGISDAIGIASAVAAHTAAPPAARPPHSMAAPQQRYPGGTGTPAAANATGGEQAGAGSLNEQPASSAPAATTATAGDDGDDTPLDYHSGVNQYTESGPSLPSAARLNPAGTQSSSRAGGDAAAARAAAPGASQRRGAKGGIQLNVAAGAKSASGTAWMA